MSLFTPVPESSYRITKLDKSAVDYTNTDKFYFYEILEEVSVNGFKLKPLSTTRLIRISSSSYWLARQKMAIAEADKVWEIPPVVNNNNDKFNFVIRGDILNIDLKPHAGNSILEDMFGSSFNNREVWANNCALWMSVNPSEPPSAFYEALHKCCYFEAQELFVKSMSPFNSLYLRNRIRRQRNNSISRIEDVAKRVANHLHPYDSETNTYSIHPHLSVIGDSTHYFGLIKAAVAKASSADISVYTKPLEFIEKFVVKVLPRVEVNLSSANSQLNSPITATVIRERTTAAGTVSWQKYKNSAWEDIPNSDGTTYTPTELVPYRAKLTGATSSNGNPIPVVYSSQIELMAPPASLSIRLSSTNDRVNTPITSEVTKVSVQEGYTIEWEVERRAGVFMEWVSAAPRGATGVSFVPLFEGNFRAKITNAVATDGTRLPTVYSNARYVTPA